MGIPYSHLSELNWFARGHNTNRREKRKYITTVHRYPCFRCNYNSSAIHNPTIIPCTPVRKLRWILVKADPIDGATGVQCVWTKQS